MISTSRTHFNSRSREGSDYNKEVEEDAKEQFQFTLP